MEENKPENSQSGRARQDRHEALDLMDLFGFYMNRLPLLIAAVLIGALAAGLYTLFLVPDKYTATSRMYMVSASSDSVVNLTDLNIGTSLSSDYVELMQTRPIIEGVIEELGLDYTYETLLRMVSLSVVPNTRIVKISATSSDPREAMAVANQMAVISQVELPKVMEAPTPTIAEMAVLPTRRSSPSLSTNVMMGSAGLLAVTLVALAIVYRMDDTIKTSEELERSFGVIPLSVIPECRIEEPKKENDSGGEASKSDSRARYKHKKPSHRSGRRKQA